tara:strand:- start:44331 stop:44915 length:585 start_codon:yes stop_codon:yes gene_type:complete
MIMRLALTISTVVLLACGGGDDDGSQSPDAAAPEFDAAVQFDAAAACTHTGLVAEANSTERDDELGVLFYTATAGSAPNIERLTFDFYFPFGATDGPHNLVFDGENLRDCHTCLVARRNCESARCSDGKAFLVQEGTASITALGAAGTSFQGTIENAVFAEVTISAADLETTVVPGGETWCIDRHDFDSEITAP